MTDPAPVKAWADGYRAALDDVANLGRHRAAELFDNLLAELRRDAHEIEGQDKRRKQRAKLQEKPTG